MSSFKTTRRAFLGGMAGSAVLGPRGLVGAGVVAEDEAYWESVRRRFDFREDKVPMNAANLCPSLRSIGQRVAQLNHDVDVDCSFQNRSKFSRLKEESRQLAAQHLGVDADEIALVRNTSEANNIVNNGLPLQAGDEIVIWDQNHPTNNVAWKVRAARFSLRIKAVATPTHPASEDELLDAFTQALGPRTKVLALTHVSNVSGVRLPVAALSRAARQRGVYVHVDGAQTWGALDVDLRKLGCDSYSASAHKWLMGPKEAGVLYVRSRRQAEIWPGVVAPGWGDEDGTQLKGARKFESLGQRDDGCLAAVADAVRFHQMVGPARIEERVLYLAGRLKSELRALGAKLVTPLAAPLSGGVVIVDVPRDQRRPIWDRLYRDYGIAGAATGGLRLCPHVYNTEKHISRALKGAASLLFG